MKILYLQGSETEVDAATTQQLRSVEAGLDITSVATSAEALIELRKAHGYQALVISSSLSQNETLALVASLRRDRVPIAILPVVDEEHQDLYAAAVSGGADDVLLRRGDLLVSIGETLARARQSPHRFPIEHQRRLNVLYAGRDTLVWNLLEQIPFVKADRVSCGIDGSCPVRAPGASDDSLRCDAVGAAPSAHCLAA